MIADYYSKGFGKEHNYGREVLIKPGTVLFTPIDGNLRAIIEAEGIKTSKKAFSVVMNPDRTPPPLFWDENLVRSDKGVFTFETKYVSDSEEVLPISYIDKIPEELKRTFLKKVPKGIHQLVNKLIGNERETRKVLHTLHDFVYEHEKPKIPTSGKPVKQLLEEYNNEGFFYGNCKEARDFYMALCNAVGYPTKGVEGKSLVKGGHVWADVFVPLEKGYGLIPVDATLKNFGTHKRKNHIFLERSPDMDTGYISRFINWIKKEDASLKRYKLKIERKD